MTRALPDVSGWIVLRNGRQDRAFRTLTSNATAGLAQGPHDAPPQRSGRRTDLRTGLYTIFVLALAPVMVLIRLATPSASEARSAQVHDAASFVDMERTRSSAGRFLVLTVTERLRESAARAMAESQRSAIAAAASCAAATAEAHRVRIDTGGVSGNSAGLMLALTVFDRLAPVDLLRGRTIAGTGAITADGRVGPVAAVGLKAVAAERAGADLFLVPRAQAHAAAKVTTTLLVRPVRHLSEAVEVLGGSGCSVVPASSR